MTEVPDTTIENNLSLARFLVQEILSEFVTLDRFNTETTINQIQVIRWELNRRAALRSYGQLVSPEQLQVSDETILECLLENQNK